MLVLTGRPRAEQVDGEPWQQSPAVLEVGFKTQALMLRRVSSAPLGRLVHSVHDVLDRCQAKGIISQEQRNQLRTEIAANLDSML